MNMKKNRITLTPVLIVLSILSNMESQNYLTLTKNRLHCLSDQY